jgi:alpha-mannosidase
MNTNEPAFPRDHRHDGHNGMDLLDYMATKAMQGMLAGHFACYGHDNYWKRDAIAEEAYEMAEAMMAERAKRKPAQELRGDSHAAEVLRAHGFPDLRA